MTSGYAWWERHGPQLPSHGIRAHTQRGAFGKTWWASRWIWTTESPDTLRPGSRVVAALPPFGRSSAVIVP